MAAALSVGLGVVAWAILALARSLQRQHRRGGRMNAMRDRLIFAGQLLFTLLVAAFLVVPGDPVDARRRHRELLPRHRVGRDPAMGDAGLGSLCRTRSCARFCRGRDARRDARRRRARGLCAASCGEGGCRASVEEIITLPLAIPGLAIALALLLTYGGFGDFRRSWLFILAGHVDLHHAVHGARR